MLPAIGLRLGTLRRRLFLLLASASVVAVVGVNLIWLPGALRDVHAARGELALVAASGVRDQIEFFLADKEEAVTTVAQLFRAAVIDGDPKGVATVGPRFLARERAFEEVGIFEPPRTWRYRLSRREVVTIASTDAPPALDGSLHLRGVAWGAVTTTETSEPWVTIATPLSGAAEGRLLVVGVLNLKDLWSLIADLQLGQSGRVRACSASAAASSITAWRSRPPTRSASSRCSSTRWRPSSGPRTRVWRSASATRRAIWRGGSAKPRSWPGSRGR